MRFYKSICVLLVSLLSGYSVIVRGQTVTVTVNGSSFCDGQPVIVSYTVSTSGGSFDDGNFFTAQLSDASGNFSSPVDIGTISSIQSGDINAIIPPGTPTGTQYRIRVVSSSPVITSDPDGSDLTISNSPSSPTLVTATPETICTSASSNLNATSDGNSISWFTTDTGGSPLGTSASGANFPVTPAATTTYYAEAFSGAACISPARTMITVTVNQIPSITSTTSGFVCGSGTVTLGAASSEGIINWYSGATGGVIIGTGISFTTPIINSNTTYFVDATANGCTTGTRTAVLATVASMPSAPARGTRTQPTCAVPTGSVVLNNLPATGTWTLTRTPGAITITGTGTSRTIEGLLTGTYTYTITNAAGCTSVPSGNVVINAPLPSPEIPVYGVDCSLGFGHAIIMVTSPAGTGIEYTLDGGAYQTANIFNNVANGDHYLAVRNVQGCTTAGGLFPVSCGCINSPTLTLSSISGTICGTTIVTVTGNSFGGNATRVTITEDGAGSVSPASTGTSPFTFTYTPVPEDAGRTVVITVTTDNPSGPPCAPATGTYTLTVNASPSAPSIGTVTSLTCASETGSVVLNGLPSGGTWTLTRSPDGITINGNGSGTTVSGLNAGTYSFTVTNEAGCISPASANAVINPRPPLPTAPVIGTITHPTCALSTGSIALSGLPTPGNWTITRSPGGVTATGTGTSSTISAIPGGTYTFTVTNSSGCVSLPSESAVVNAQPPTPPAPLVGLITPPSCILATGSVNLSGLPASGTWTLTRYPGTVTTTGTGTSGIVSALATGTYNFTVTNNSGCISVPSANVIIPVQPPKPAIPVIENVIQPTYDVPTGSVIFSGLPSSGTWIITRLPDNVTKAGTGDIYTLEGLTAGSYTFTLTNSYGCTSEPSDAVRISVPGPPDIIITDPSAVCSPATVDLTAPEITAGSTSGLIYTYWTDAEATTEYNTPATAIAGTYFIKGTTLSGYFNIKPVIVTIDEIPVANAGPDQILFLQYSTTMDADLNADESGVWSLDSGKGEISDTTDPRTSVSKLAFNNNILLWTVTRGVCPPVTNSVTITVSDIVIPTLLTPNGDPRNEYFEIQGIEALGKTELIVFDRRGAMMFKNSNYDNKWNGVDYNDNPLPDDTYFYVLKSSGGMSKKGFVVIRR